MHRFLGKEPPQKRKKTPDEISKANKQYELEKRKRTFQDSWRKKFELLLYDTNHLVMYCLICRSIYGPFGKNKPAPSAYAKYTGGPMVTGCTNFKVEVLNIHAASDGHKLAVQQKKAAAAKPGETVAKKSIQSLNKAVFDRLSHLFRNAHAIAFNSRPFKDFVWMASLDELKGINIGKTYRNDKQCYAFIQAIAAVERTKIEETIQNVKFMSVLSDGSVDVSTTENEAVYVRVAFKGTVSVFFMGMKKVSRANASGIYGALMSALKLKSLPSSDVLAKLVGYGSDGASVNTGQENGVIALLRKNIDPAIIIVHCMAHRLELAFKSAVKDFKQYDKLNTLLTELFAFYHRSALQTENLKTAYAACNLPVSLPHRVGGTRWVSHLLGAMEQLWKGYPAFVMHLTQVSKYQL